MKLEYIMHKISITVFFAAVLAAVMACSAPSSSEAPKKSSNTAAAQPSIPPLGTPVVAASPTASPNTPNQACWDQIQKSPAAVACTTMFAFSSQTCVAGVSKQASCTRDDINKVYSTAQINGQSAMAQVDKWIAAGFSEMQCAIGNADQQLYVYFLKRTFNAGATADIKSTYTFEEQTLGPPGAIIDSIKLNAPGSPGATATCG